mmetsp:Transcript_116048/g.339317  ORF Transcript_116048/g.339317 Transcript_116048/m.339317 type:complete len:91 (+) Transcript_116048:940-1212(+)
MLLMATLLTVTSWFPRVLQMKAKPGKRHTSVAAKLPSPRCFAPPQQIATLSRVSSSIRRLKTQTHHQQMVDNRRKILLNQLLKQARAIEV